MNYDIYKNPENYEYYRVGMMTYQQAASDHHVAEVLAGHQGECALLLELPDH